MRTQLLAYLTASLTGSVKTSQELPYEEGGNALYQKNPRRVYLDEPYTEMNSIYPTLNGGQVNERIIIVKGYLTADAKNRNNDLDQALVVLAQAKNQITTDSHKKEFDYTVDITNSVITYNLEYRFHSITN
jgi:hypothetical protein